MDQPANMTDYDRTYAAFQWQCPENYNFAQNRQRKDPTRSAQKGRVGTGLGKRWHTVNVNDLLPIGGFCSTGEIITH